MENDVERYLKSANEQFGDNVLCIYNDTVTLNCTILSQIFQKYSFDFIKDELRDNLFLQLSLTKLIQNSLKITEPFLTNYFKTNGLSLSSFQRLVNSRSLKERSMRLDLSEMIMQFIRPQLQALISPIQTNIVNFLEQVRSFIMKLYVDEESTGFLKTISNITNPIVSQCANFISSIEDSINNAVNNFLYNNGTTPTTTSTGTITTPISITT